MSFVFNNFFFEPLFNALVFLSSVVPGHDLGVAIILLTFGVRLILLPLQHRMSHTQRKLKLIEPQIKGIKDKHSADKTEQAKQIMALYKEHGINPLAGFWLLLIQLPILFALFKVFRQSFNFDPALIYSFIHPATAISLKLFGLIDLTSKSYVLAVLAGVTQFIQTRLALPPTPANPAPNLKSDFAKSLNLQMRYVLPVMVVFISLGLPAAIAVYWVTSNLVSVAHELWVKRQAKSLLEVTVPTN